MNFIQKLKLYYTVSRLEITYQWYVKELVQAHHNFKLLPKAMRDKNYDRFNMDSLIGTMYVDKILFRDHDYLHLPNLVLRKFWLEKNIIDLIHIANPQGFACDVLLKNNFMDVVRRNLKEYEQKVLDNQRKVCT